LTNSAVNSNAADEGGGLVVRAMVRNEGASMSNTILAGNTAALAVDCIGVVKSLGHILLAVTTAVDSCPDKATPGAPPPSP